MKPKLTMPPGKVTYVNNYVVLYSYRFRQIKANELFAQGYRLVATTPEPGQETEYIFERMTMEGLDINEFRVQEATHATV